MLAGVGKEGDVFVGEGVLRLCSAGCVLSAAFTQVGAGHLVRLVKPSLLVVPM